MTRRGRASGEAPSFVSDTAEQLARTAQRASLRTALVNGRRYELDLGEGGREVVVVPGVGGTDDTAAIPEREVRFVGAPVCVEISLKQSNSFVDFRELPEPFVGALTGWSIALDGVVVYGQIGPSLDAVGALVEAAATVPRLLRLPIRPWLDDDWRDRRVLLDRRPAVVVELEPHQGKAVLVLEDDDGSPLGEEERVDLLSDRISWAREPELGAG